MKFIDPSIENYAIRHTSIPSSICDELEEFTKSQVEWPQMLSGKLEGSLLGFILRLTKAKSILEIGTYTGYCTLNLAENSLPDAKVITLDINENYSKVAKSFWNKSTAGNKITQIIGPALETIAHLDEKFDFVFIDADKANYMNYFKVVLDKLNPGAVVMIDNVLWSGKILNADKDEDTTIISQLNEYILEQDHLYKTLIPIRDGIFMVQKI